jgi:hypothetical protein
VYYTAVLDVDEALYELKAQGPQFCLEVKSFKATFFKFCIKVFAKKLKYEALKFVKFTLT